MADLGLCYYIHGKRTALSVCVSSNETILFLKRKIYDEVSLPANMGSPTLVDTTALQDESPFKRRRLADDPCPPWLQEVHSKIWNRKDLEPELFRKVKVTQTHYNELQKRLKEQHPDRDSPEYDGRKHNVQSVKLDLLRSITPVVPRHPNNNEDDDLEASNEDSSDINTFFPSTFSFLDLSTLGLKAKVQSRLPLPLFLRREYHHISAIIEDEQDSVIISGQPGTGKTAYLYLRIIQSMIEGREFLYQANNGTVYHVNENGVRAIRSWSSHEEIVAFVDGDRESYVPDDMFDTGTVQIIVAASPRGANRGWIDQANDVTIFATKLWSPRELFLTGIFLYPFDISIKLLRLSTSYFGYNPRLCFSAAHSVKVLKRKKEEVISRIRDVASENSNMLQLLRSSQCGDSDVSHSIFVISPKDELRLFARCEFGAVSRWALDLFLKEYETRQADEVTSFCRYISRTSDAASLRDHVFERQVLNYLGGIDLEHKFLIRGLTSSEQTTWTYRGPFRRFDFLQDLDFIDEITKAVQIKERLHLVPSALNFPAVDSILYEPDEVLTCIQIIHREHRILVSGLQLIQSWLKLDTPLAGLRPSKERPWRFIFVVPSDKASLELQRLEGDTVQGEWAGMVHRYVLRLDVAGKRPG